VFPDCLTYVLDLVCPKLARGEEKFGLHPYGTDISAHKAKIPGNFDIFDISEAEICA